MITDNAIIMATAEAVPNGAAAPGGLGGNTITGGATTPYTIDLLQSSNPIGSGIDDIGSTQIEMNVSITTAFTTTSPVATLEFQLVSVPILPSLLSNATTSGKLLSGSFTATVASSTWGAAAHGLQLGTPLYFSAIGTVTGVTTNTLYFAVPSDANNFKVATSLANALAGTTVTLGGTNAACTTVFMPAVHATTGAIPTVFLKAGARILGTSMRQVFAVGGKLIAPYAGATPLPLGASVMPGTGTGGGAGAAVMRTPGRYLALNVIAAGASSGTTGRYSVQIGKNVANILAHYPVGSEIK